MNKSSVKFYLFMFSLNFFVRNLLLFILGIIMCVIGIWNKNCQAVGIAALCFDAILSAIQTIQTLKTARKECDDPEWNAWKDAINGGPDSIMDKVGEAIQNGEVNSPDEEPESDGHQEILQKLVVYRTLKASIHDGMTLEEMIDAFAEMCKISVGDPDDLLYETGNFDFTGEKQFYFSLVRQFKFLDDDEYVQLRLEVTFPPNAQTALCYTTKWSTLTNGDFFNTVKKSRGFRVAKKLSISSVNVRVEET